MQSEPSSILIVAVHPVYLVGKLADLSPRRVSTLVLYGTVSTQYRSHSVSKGLFIMQPRFHFPASTAYTLVRFLYNP